MFGVGGGGRLLMAVRVRWVSFVGWLVGWIRFRMVLVYMVVVVVFYSLTLEIFILFFNGLFFDLCLFSSFWV